MLTAWGASLPSGHTTCNPRGFLVDITRTRGSTKFPHHFHVKISTWKISACILRGKIHVENFHVDYPCSFLPLFRVENFHFTSTWKYPRGKFPRVLYVEKSTWTISTRIIRVCFYHFSTPFPHGKFLCVFYVEKSTWKIFTRILVHFSLFSTWKIFMSFPHYFYTWSILPIS